MTDAEREKYDAEFVWWQVTAVHDLEAKLLIEQKGYYSGHLEIPEDYPCGRLLDVGSGPILPARYLRYDELWCVDPLFARYFKAGFALKCPRTVLLRHFAEHLWSIPDDWFDTVVSVNALDHVDCFEETVGEIERVAKPDALLRLRVMYHESTPTEPIALSDERFCAAFHRFEMVRLTKEALHGQILWSNRER